MIGSIFLDRYRICEELGRGGMGVVYKAEDTKLKRDIALKFLPQDLTRDPLSKERFVHEAQAASALDHPGICTVHEIDETDDGQMFISMACYDGETLKDRVERGQLEVGEAIDIAIQVALGLEEAHEKGIVHRDIKPSNIIVTTKGQAKIMDFGLAKLAGQTRITKAGTTMGTIAYMSPEQARGEDIDHRTDIWSLGVVLYELLTGEQPFKGEYDQAVIYSILNEDSRPLTEVNQKVPPEIDAIAGKCLRKVPDERYQSSSELASDLMGLRKGSSALSYVRTRKPAPSLGALTRSSVFKVGIPLAVVLAVAILLSVVPAGRHAFERLLGGEPSPERVKVAILPCTMEGGAIEDQAFCDGMIRNLTGVLRGLEQVQGRVWVMPAVDVEKLDVISPTEVYRELGVSVTVSGSFRRLGDRRELALVRNDLDVEIQDGKGEEVVRKRNARPVSDPIANLSTWQDSVIVAVTDLLDISVDLGRDQDLISVRTMVPQAYESMLRGIGFLYPYDAEPDLESAVGLLEAAIGLDPSYSKAYVWVARGYMSRYLETRDRHWAELGLDACRKALELNPDGRVPHYVMGEIHRVSGEDEEAIDAYRMAIEGDESDIWSYIGMGKAYSSMGNLAEAGAAYRRATEDDPLYFGAHHFLGFTLYQQGRYEEAIEPFRSLIELRPQKTTGYNNLGGIYFQLGRWTEARDIWEESLAIDSTRLVCSNLGTVYFIEARYIDAARMYRKVLEISGEDYSTLGNLAECYYWIPGEEERAGELFEKAIVLGEEQMKEAPDDAALLSRLAGYHAKLGHISEARDLLDAVTNLEPSNPSLFLVMADTYELIGERETAVGLVREAFDAGVPPASAERFPGLRELRADPRYRQILDECGKDTDEVSSSRMLPAGRSFSTVFKGGERSEQTRS
jgi:serine/threonine-protein kinase